MNASQLAYWIVVILATGVYLGVNYYFMRAIQPRRDPKFKTLQCVVISHWLPQAVVLVSLALLLQLIIAPMLLMSLVLVFLLLANNKKYASLNEPLVPSDIAMTLRQWRNMQLLTQYVRRDWSVLIVLPAILAAASAVVAYEPRLLGRYFLTLGLLSPVPMAIAFWPPQGKPLLIRLMVFRHIPYFEWDLCLSVTVGGFFATFLRCLDSVPRPAIRSISSAAARVVLDEQFGKNGVARPRPSRMPNIVVVLAEGFIDPRQFGITVEPEPLVNYDEAVRRSIYSGRCSVPVYGGWTIRSEYSLLTGINLSTFANNIGNPNVTLVSAATHSLPKHLKSLGYRTAIIHPHDRRFYGRGQACPLLGFDDFIDEERFGDAPREGRYVSDPAVATRVAEELRRATEPTFLFCITMENHGPWHGKEPPPMAPFTVRPQLTPESHSAFANYLRHLRNADQMIGQLTDMVATAEAPTIVLVVGDHLPALTDMFREVDNRMFRVKESSWVGVMPWKQTSYFLLSNMPAERCEMNCDISFLSGLVLDCAGLNGDRFFHENSAMRCHLNGNIHADPKNKTRQAYLRFCYDLATSPERYVSAPSK